MFAESPVTQKLGRDVQGVEGGEEGRQVDCFVFLTSRFRRSCMLIRFVLYSRVTSSHVTTLIQVCWSRCLGTKSSKAPVAV